MRSYEDGPISNLYVSWANTLDSTGKDSTLARERLNDHEIVRLLHASLGLCTESGEVLDSVKKFVFYGQEIDRENIIEEAGDILWYTAILAKFCGFHTLDEFMLANKAKLTARYGDTWSQESALNRDVQNEMTHLSEALPKKSENLDKYDIDPQTNSIG